MYDRESVNCYGSGNTCVAFVVGSKTIFPTEIGSVISIDSIIIINKRPNSSAFNSGDLVARDEMRSRMPIL